MAEDTPRQFTDEEIEAMRAQVQQHDSEKMGRLNARVRTLVAGKPFKTVAAEVEDLMGEYDPNEEVYIYLRATRDQLNGLAAWVDRNPE
jgi:hypothetical protein